jgi:general secretion pathway protein G
MKTLQRNSEKGFTLIEVLLVIIVIGIMAAVAFKSMDVALDNSRWDATTQEMERLSWAIAGNPDLFANGVRSDFGYVGDVGSLPPNLDALVTNPGGYATWRGPYIRNDFNQNPNDFKTDAWGNLYTYTGGVTIASGGSGGNPITKQYANAPADLTANTVQGTITDGQGNSPGGSNTSISVRIAYPNGTGGTTTATATPSTYGNYTFVGIPQGLRTVTAIYSPTNDTLVRTAVVLPKSTTLVDFKFRGNLWGGAGGSGGSLSYVSGSAVLQNGGADVSFQIRNNGSSSVTVTSLKATYTHTPDGYYKLIKWNGTEVANHGSNPKFQSGQTVTFSLSRTIASGATATIILDTFTTSPNGGANLNMAGTTFTIEFSDGSIITFSV